MFNSVFRRVSLAVLLLMIGVIPTLVAGEKVQWEKLIETGMKEAAKTGKPILLDFYKDS